MPTITTSAENQIRQVLAEPNALRELLSGLRLDDIVEATDGLSDAESLAVFAQLEDERAIDFLFDLGPSLVKYLVLNSPRSRIVALLDRMPMDDAADVVSGSDETVRDELLTLLAREAPQDAEEVRQLLAYPEGSAGRLMTDKFVRLRAHQTLAEAFETVRQCPPDTETVTNLYVVGEGGTKLIGVVSMRSLVTSPSGLKVEDIMAKDLITVNVDTPEADLAHLIAKHDFLAMPVLSESGALVGIVTVDDIIDVMIEGFNDDIAKMVGTDAHEMDRRNSLQVAKLRLPWLLGTMAIELGAGLVISRYDYVLTHVILLASFMPVISAISGNVGLQAAAIVVRGLDTGYVKMKETRRAVRKEFFTTLIMASVCGLLLGTIGSIWAKHPFFGVVVGVAMGASMMTAGFMGTIIPMLSKKLGFDPATTAGPFETAFQDVIGFGVLLWVASLLLPVLK